VQRTNASLNIVLTCLMHSFILDVGRSNSMARKVIELFFVSTHQSMGGINISVSFVMNNPDNIGIF